MLPQLGRKVLKSTLVVSRFLELVEDPVLLLRRDARRRDDGRERVDEEEDEDLAVTGTGAIKEGEGGDSVLVDVGEDDAALRGRCERVVRLDKGVAAVANRVVRTLVVEYNRGFLLVDSPDNPRPTSVVLLVMELKRVEGAAERKATFGDILLVI